jgi:cholesterol oxidase
MIGCRYGAKNTLDFNYLWLAGRSGATIQPDSEVTWIRPLPGAAGGFEVTTREGKSPLQRTSRAYRAQNVVMAGGVLGTVELLLKLQRDPGGLPKLSRRLGDRVRTNSEVLVGITSRRRRLDHSEGIAITSILHTDEHSHVEPVRFSKGSGFFRLLALPHAPGRTLGRRLLNAAGRVLRHPLLAARAFLVRDWARSTTVLLYMRTLESHLRLRLGRRALGFFRWGLKSEPGSGPLPTAAIPEATDLAERFAAEVDGLPGSLLTETLLGVPTTAHILGGCCMGSSAEDGVIDHRHKVFGYEGLYVIDGSSVSANPGVNPSLTITALAERAMSLIPKKPAAAGGPATEASP